MYQGQLLKWAEALRKKAHADGGQNRPSSNESVQTQHETELDKEAERFAVMARTELETVVLAARGEVERLLSAAKPLSSTCAELVDGFGIAAAAKVRLGALRQRLLAVKVRELRCQAAVNQFRAEHNLRRDAYYPDSLAGHLSYVVAALGIEALLNANFFRNDLGLLGGALIASFVSLVNLVVAALLGAASRFHHHRHTGLKTLGWASIVLFAFWSIYFNSLIASSRFFYSAQVLTAVSGGDASVESSAMMQTAFVEAMQQATRVFVLDPPFQELESFLLFFVGVFLSLFAFYKGYTVDDPYPGYGAVCRPYDAAKQQGAPAMREVTESLEAEVNKRLESIQKARAQLLEGPSRLLQLRASVDAARNQCNAQLARIVIDHAQARHAYRHANVGTRTTPAPPYFAHNADVVPRTHDGGASAILVGLDDAVKRYHELHAQFLEPLLASAQSTQDEADRLFGHLVKEYEQGLLVEAKEKIAAEAVVHPDDVGTRR
jgi:hypothetical protein